MFDLLSRRFVYTWSLRRVACDAVLEKSCMRRVACDAVLAREYRNDRPMGMGRLAGKGLEHAFA